MAPGDSIEVHVIDTGGGEITPDSTTSDIDTFDWDNFTPLTGPIEIDGAEPGDTVKITFLSFAPCGWGWSIVSPRYGAVRHLRTRLY